MTDLRTLVARMADELDYYRQLLVDDRREIHALAAEARAALAEPQTPAGEVAELVKWLRGQDGGLGRRAMSSRAADLLERLAATGKPGLQVEPTDEELLGIDDLRDAWNAHADSANSWDELGIDEIVWWAQQQALARWGRPSPQPIPVSERLPEGHV
jgi:hypothetical protein